MPDRFSTGRENPGVRNASWNKARGGVQDIQEIAGAREWVEPRMQRDDSREGTGLEPLRNLADVPVRTMAETLVGQSVAEAQVNLPAPTAEPIVGLPRSLPGNPVLEFQFCILCGANDKDSLLIPGQDFEDGHQVCDKCVDRLIDRLRAAIPKRRLRLALERMMAGEVTEAMVAEVERLTGGKI